MPYLIALTILLAPAYIIKFNLFGLPANLLMVWIFAVWIIFTVGLISKKSLSAFCTNAQTLDKKVLTLILLFFISGLIALFVHGFDRQKLGQFIVLFLQPISIFFIVRFIFQQYPTSKYSILNTLYIILAAAGIYAIIQYFTLLGLPSAWWGNSVEPKRALSFFVHPNFYALFAAPLLAFLIPDVATNISLPLRRRAREGWKGWIKSVAWLLGALGLLLSFSRAGWLGLAAAVLVYLIVAADRKIRRIILGGVIVIVIVIVATPNLRWRLILPFRGEKSTNSRIELWQGGWKAIKQSPITGLGLTGFAANYQNFITDKTLDTHNYPHNIFLDFWVETGLLGLISFVGLCIFFIYRGLKKFPLPNAWGGAGERLGLVNKPTSPLVPLHRLERETLQLALSLFLIALLVQGLIDNPYFKNDLAMVFWLILSLA